MSKRKASYVVRPHALPAADCGRQSIESNILVVINLDDVLCIVRSPGNPPKFLQRRLSCLQPITLYIDSNAKQAVTPTHVQTKKIKNAMSRHYSVLAADCCVPDVDLCCTMLAAPVFCGKTSGSARPYQSGKTSHAPVPPA